MKMIKRLLLAAGLLAGMVAPAAAQSGCKYIVYGAVLTAAQWNYCFQAKNDTLGYIPLNKAGDSMSGKLTLMQPNGIVAPLNVPLAVAAPSAPVNGDIWVTASGLNIRLPGQTVGPFNTPTFTGGSAPSFPTLYSFWNNTAGATIPYSIYDGVQWVNIGTLDPATHTWTAASGSAVTSFSAGSTGFTPSSATTGVITLAGTLNVGHGGTGLTAGTSGGIPYFSSTSAMTSSALLTANQLVIGGGAGAAPASLGSLGSATTVLHGGTGAPSFSAVSLTADVSGILPGANGGSGVANTGTTFTRSANLTTTGAGATTLAFGASTQTYTFPTTTATLARTDTGQTFTGTNAFGVLTATSFNGNTFTTGTGVLTLGAGKTLTASNTLTLAGTDSTVMTFPTTSATIARTDAGQTFTGANTFSSATTLSSALTYGGVTLSNAVTGTGNMVLSASPALTGNPTAPTQSNGDNSTKLATTAYVANAITASLTQGSGLISQATGQSISGTPARVTFDTPGYSSGSVVTCDTSSTKGLCTVNTAGRYQLTCAFGATATTGGAVGTSLATAELWKNNADFTNGGISSVLAQVGSISGMAVNVSVTANNTFAANDTFSCAVSTAATGSPVTSSNQLRNWLSWTYLGP